MDEHMKPRLDDAGQALCCPVCSSEAQVGIETLNSYEMRKCPDCSFVYTRLRQIPASQYEAVYADEPDYRRMVRIAEQTASGEKGFRQLRWFKRKALRWVDAKRPGGRLLEVGSGPGTFLLVAKRLGWSVQGVEPTQLAAEKAQSLGAPTFNGFVEDFAATHDEKFDVVVSFEVVEHVPDVIRILSVIRSLLKPDGIFVFSVPNLDDPYTLHQKLQVNLPPLHINFFRRQSMTTALARAGFETDRYATLPIPTTGVRNDHGLFGMLVRAPWLFGLSMIGKADGTTLLGMARPAQG